MKLYVLQIQWSADREFEPLNYAHRSPMEYTLENAEKQKQVYKDSYTRIVEVELTGTWYELDMPTPVNYLSYRASLTDFANLGYMKKYAREWSTRWCDVVSVKDNTGTVVYAVNTIAVNPPFIDYYEVGLTFDVGSDEERWSFAVQSAFRTEGKEIDIAAFRAIWEGERELANG